MTKFVWNKEKSEAVAISRIRGIREITITSSAGSVEPFLVRGWYNPNEFFTFGYFSTREEAQLFIEKINDK